MTTRTQLAQMEAEIAVLSEAMRAKTEEIRVYAAAVRTADAAKQPAALQSAMGDLTAKQAELDVTVKALAAKINAFNAARDALAA